MITQVGLLTRHPGEKCERERASAFIDTVETFFHRRFSSQIIGPVIMGVVASSKRELTGIEATRAVCITSDARLDDPVQSTLGTSAFLASQYERYGMRCWSRLVGDYAVACWDAREQVLHLVRDFCGTRPLYIHCNADVVLWSSSLRFLMAMLGPALEIDDNYIAEFLTGTSTRERTPYQGIRSVPPGFALTIQGEKQTTKQFWDIRDHRQIVYRRDEDYELHFRDLFTQSVERRLRHASTALADLSGGIDSPSVVCVADDLIRSGRAQCVNLETVSFRYDGSPLSDESRSIACVETRRGRASHHIFEGRFLVPGSLGADFTKPDWWALLPDSAEQYSGLRNTLGADVLLCGIGGDEVFEATALKRYEVLEPLRRMRLSRGYRSLKSWAAAENQTIGEVMRDSIRGYWLNRRAEFAFDNTELILANLSPHFVEKFHCKDRLDLRQQFGDVRNTLRRHHFAAISAAVAFVSECFQRESMDSDLSYPFLDRSLVEFLLAIPAGQKNRPGETKSLLRRSLGGVLPDRLRLRKNKVGGPTQPLMRAIRRNWAELSTELADAEIFERGYADRQSFFSHLKNAKHGLTTAAPSSTWKLLVLERLLQTRRQRTRSAQSLNTGPHDLCKQGRQPSASTFDIVEERG